MRIPDEELDEFIEIYKEELSEDISRAEATEMASRLLTLYQLLSRKLPSEHSVSQNTKRQDDLHHGDHSPIGFRT